MGHKDWDNLRKKVFPKLDNIFGELGAAIGNGIDSLSKAREMFEGQLKRNRITKQQLISYMVENFAKGITQMNGTPRLYRMTAEDFQEFIQAAFHEDPNH